MTTSPKTTPVISGAPAMAAQALDAPTLHDNPDAVSLESIEAARERIQHHLYRSPLTHSRKLSQKLGSKIFLKLENLQLTGSFKERGALNKLLTLTPEESTRGVIAASAGNHAQGLAFHATRLGIPSTLVMPEGTPLIKETRTREYGAHVILKGATFDEAFEHAVALAQERSLTFVHPFNDPEIISGQGTIGLELLEDNPYLEYVIVPVGGGGLISGIAVALKEINPRIKIIGVESRAISAMRDSLHAGRRISPHASRTLADGIAVRLVGDRTFALVQRYVDDIVTVDEEDIASAILQFLEEEKTVAEGAAAVTLAALRAKAIPNLQNRKVALIVSGGNIDVNILSRIIGRGLAKDGRMMALRIALDDSPGALADLTSNIARLRANIIEIHHERNFALLGKAVVDLTLETKGNAHIQHIRSSLEDDGYLLVNPL